MKKTVAALLCVLLSVTMFSGCGILFRAASRLRTAVSRNIPAHETALKLETPAIEETESDFDTETPAETEAPEKTKEATETAQPAITASTLSGDSENLSGADMLEFFRQVVFGSNIDDQALCKWMDPIVVSVSGNYNDADSEQLTNVFDSLNDYDGFPGVTYLEAAGADANVGLEVKFVTADVLRSEQPKWSGDAPCYAVYWEDKNEIYKGVVYLVPDMVQDQAERNYLLTWGVFYTMGFFNDSGVYYDSIFNPYFIDDQLGSSFTRPVGADWHLVSMLYNKAVKPGMSYEEAAGALAK